MAITILDIALAHGAQADSAGSINGSEFARLDLPFFGGCESCEASIAAYNAFPSRSGFLRCRSCIDDIGFACVADFDEWEKNAA